MSSSHSSDSSKVIEGDLVGQDSAENAADKPVQPSPKWKPAKSAKASEAEATVEANTKTNINAEAPAEESKAEASKTSSQERRSKSSAQPAASSPEKKNGWFVPTLKWGGSLAVILAAIVYTRPDQSWQIAQINDLQSQVVALQAVQSKVSEQSKSATSEVANLQDSLVALQGHLKQLEEQFNQAQAESGNGFDLEKFASNESVQALQEQVQQQWNGLQGQVKELFTQLSDVAKTMSEQADTSDSTGTADAPAAENSDQIAADDVPSTVETVKQAAQNLMDNIAQTMPKVMAPIQEAIKIPNAQQNPLDSLRIQQWLLAINSQWMVSQNVEHTQEQLLAIESVIGLSDFAHKAQFSRAVGKDLAYLEGFAKAKAELPNIQALRDAVQALKINRATIVEQVEQKAEAAENAESTETSSAASNWDALLARLSQMVTIQKRDADAGQTKVESLLMEDVLRQRAMLLVDRMDWAMQSQNPSALSAAAGSLQAFVAQNFAEQAAAINAELTAYANVQFVTPKSLGIIQQFSAAEMGGKE